ncbi:redoxin domain-containing protein [Flavobacteriaceae bacterium R38]|nr:redoxin domain-containing protein [Flavobacteriaceae bacterium R38]
MRTLILILAFCSTIISNASILTTGELKGEWKGAYIMNAHVVNFNMYVKKENNQYKVTVDIPSQNKYNEVYNIKVDGNEFYLSQLNKQNILIEYKGRIEGKNITGSFHFNTEYMKDKPGIFQLMKSNAKFIKGEKLPDFELVTLNQSGRITNADYKGKYLFLDFWATWCPPCVAKRPKLEAINEKLGDKIEIVSVSLDRDIAVVEKFRKEKFPMQWTHVLKAEKMRDPFIKAVVPNGLPYGYLIDKEGRIVAFGNELDAGKLESTVKRVLSSDY